MAPTTTTTSTTSDHSPFTSTLTPTSDNYSDIIPTTTYDIDVDAFLEARNWEYFSSMAPTVAYLVSLIVLGLAGNAVTLLVYSRRFKPSPLRVYILAMSVCDLVTNLCSLPIELALFRTHYTAYFSWACQLSWTLLTFLVIVTGLLFVAVAVDRERHVCRQRPMRAAESVKSAKLAVGGCVLISLVVSLPAFRNCTTHRVLFNGANVTGSKCFQLDPEADVYGVVYGNVLNVVFAVGMAVMVVCYGRIARRLWQHKKSRKIRSRQKNDSISRVTKTSSSLPARTDESSGEPAELQAQTSSSTELDQGIQNPEGTVACQHRQATLTQPEQNASTVRAISGAGARGKKIPASATLMLFVLTVVAVVNYLPHLVLRIMGDLNKGSESFVVDDSRADDNLSEILFRSYYLNSVINPLVYSFCSPRFRLELRNMFSRRSGRCP